MTLPIATLSLSPLVQVNFQITALCQSILCLSVSFFLHLYHLSLFLPHSNTGISEHPHAHMCPLTHSPTLVSEEKGYMFFSREYSRQVLEKFFNSIFYVEGRERERDREKQGEREITPKKVKLSIYLVMCFGLHFALIAATHRSPAIYYR